MIRRDAGADYLLFAQHDHALLAGQFARRFGTGAFAKPTRGPAMIDAVDLHDCGWPLHDDAPTLSAAGRPLDVFEVSRDIALPIWTASADGAEVKDPYTGLLVSLHVLSLSVYATSDAPAKHEKFDLSDMRERFEVNKFQHREVERQEQLRRRLGLGVDRPLTHGIAAPGTDAAEDALTFDFRVLQAMDQLSLALCCTVPPMAQTTPVPRSPGGGTTHLRVWRDAEYRIRVDPWPFDVPGIEVDVPARRVRGGTYRDQAELRDAYARAPVEHVQCEVMPATNPPGA